MDAEQWLKHVISSNSINAAAVKAGITPATLFRQIKRGTISAGNVIHICRAYGYPPASGLVETGYLTAAEVGGSAVEDSLRGASNEQLLGEISRRLGPPGENNASD